MDVNARTSRGHTALWFAVENGRAEVVEALLRARADFRGTPPDDSLLRLACRSYPGNARMAQMLIDAGTDVRDFTIRPSCRNQEVTAVIQREHERLAQRTAGAAAPPPAASSPTAALPEARSARGP